MTKDASRVEVVAADSIVIYRMEDIDSCTAILAKTEYDVEMGIKRYRDLSATAERIEQTVPEYKVVMYTVEIEQKSTKKDVIKVIMEQDGVTPYTTEGEFLSKRNPFIERLANDWAVVDVPDE